MAARVHLIRHGEVHNPNRIVYGRLPGFGLSSTGRLEAAATAEYLAVAPISAVISSPLDRAAETAAAIAARHGLPVETDPALSEWHLSDRWQGVGWDALPREFPGELEAYLSTPADLPFSPEPLAEVAARVAAMVEAAHRRVTHGEIAVVSHQDPIQAGRLRLTGRDLRELHVDKPGHASVVTLEPDDPWRELAHWFPPVESPQGSSWPPPPPD